MKSMLFLMVAAATSFLSLACMNRSNTANAAPTPLDQKLSDELSLSDTSLTKVTKTDAEWRALLTADQYFILREQGTEPSFNNAYWNNHEAGHYFCAGCHLPLFSSATKFESGTGWPSFFAPISMSRVKTVVDNSHGMVRGETVCARCEGHLGHVFDDGPKPTGLRYCMDSGALLFKKSGKK